MIYPLYWWLNPAYCYFCFVLLTTKFRMIIYFYKKLYYYAAAKVTLNNDNSPEPQLHTESVLEATNLHTAGTEAAGIAGRMLQISKTLAWEHPTKQRRKERQIWAADQLKSFISSCQHEVGGPWLSSQPGRGHIPRDRAAKGHLWKTHKKC